MERKHSLLEDPAGFAAEQNNQVPDSARFHRVYRVPRTFFGKSLPVSRTVVVDDNQEAPPNGVLYMSKITNSGSEMIYYRYES